MYIKTTRHTQPPNHAAVFLCRPHKHKCTGGWGSYLHEKNPCHNGSSHAELSCCSERFAVCIHAVLFDFVFVSSYWWGCWIHGLWFGLVIHCTHSVVRLMSKGSCAPGLGHAFLLCTYHENRGQAGKEGSIRTVHESQWHWHLHLCVRKSGDFTMKYD